MIRIPLRSLPDYIFEVTLEDVPYLFHVKWNVRSSRWTLDVSSIDGTLLIGGLSMLLQTEMLRAHPGRDLPPGALMLLDPSGDVTDVGYDDLEERCSLIYLTEAEYAALQ